MLKIKTKPPAGYSLKKYMLVLLGLLTIGPLAYAADVNWNAYTNTATIQSTDEFLLYRAGGTGMRNWIPTYLQIDGSGNITGPTTITSTFIGGLTGNVTGNVSGSSGSTTGNAATATALAANGTNCGAGNYPLGVDASGNAESCTAAAGAGTVTSVSVTTANGVSGSVATATTTPAITLTLGAITPSSVNSVVLSGSATPTLAVTGTSTIAGTNTGDQTSVTGNAGTATALQNARLIGNVSFDGTADITPTQIQPAVENSDTTNFIAFFNAASGTAQQPKYNASFGYNASTGVLTSTGFAGALTGNVTGNVSGSSGSTTGNAATATALAANGANCSSGNSPLGVDASGAVESCFDVWTEAENTAAAYMTAGSVNTVTNKNLTSGTNTFPTFNQNTTGTAAIATTTTITDDTTTNATMYPTWVTANTGNLPQKTSSTKISFNPSTGVLSSTGFAGPLTGAVTGNVTGNVSGSSGSTTGNAATATALAANGSNCGAGNYPLGVDASGNAESCTAAGGGSPGGSNTQVQFNDSSAFGGDAGLVYNKTTDALDVAGNLSSTRYNLGNDVSIAPVVGGQSYIGAYWGLQLAGNQQVIPSGVTPANIGANGDYNVIIGPSPTVGSISLGIREVTSQTGDAFQVQNSSATVLARITAAGNISATNLSGTNTGDQTSVTGNAGTATALAANGANCSAGQYPLGVNASGAVESCTTAVTTPDNADYLVGTANGSLSAEIVVGTSPGGELGGTWATPTIDDGVTVDSWVMTGTLGLTVNNGATAAGAVGFKEDSDNGTNTVTVIGPASTADATLTLQGTTGTIYSSGGTDIAVADGGTNLSSGTSGGILGFTGGTTLASSVALTANALVLGGGAGATPTPMGSLGTTTTLLHGNAAGAPTFAAVSLTADVSGILPGANGGTGNGFFAVSGPATSLKTFTFPNASSTVLTSNAAVTVGQGGTGIASGTSGGIPFYSGTTTIASSGLLAANGIVVGGGAATTPVTRTVAIDSNDAISLFKTTFNNQTGTTYTALSTDTGKTVTLTNAGAITVTLPNNLAIGWTCEMIQGGAGQVSFVGGGTIQNRSTHTKIAGQYGAIRLTVVTNAGGTAAVYNLAGDTAP